MGRVTKQNVVEVMTYKAPDEVAVGQHKRIQEGAIAFAEVVLTNAPECADTTTAIRKIREAKLWANSAIALGGQI